MSKPVEMISVRATEQIVDALNQAVELEGGASTRTEFLLRRLQSLLDRETRCVLWLLEQLSRKPAPLIVSRTAVRPDFDNAELLSLATVQRALEDSMPLSGPMIARVLKQMRTPVTMIASESGDPQWFERVVQQRHLAPMGYADCLVSMWAASPDRAIVLICHRRAADRPFSAHDCTIMSLALRAVAPIVDRDIFRRASLDPPRLEPSPLEPSERLSPREREILLMLLAGDSEKEIAAALHRSPHTVHTFVQRLYRLFGVSSRGELMALFVDKAVLASLHEDASSIVAAPG